MSSKQDRAGEPAQRQISKPYMDSADIVIIGNGIAGLVAAIEARHLAPDKRIVIITDQIHPTINTPALKQFAIGKVAREQLLAYPAGTERTERIHIVTARVEEIHARSKYVTLNGKRGFGYGSLLIATGGSPQGLPANIPGRDFDGVMTLHRLQDYLSLRRRIGEVSEAVVVGGGVHAIETVMGLQFWGIRVHWLIRGTTLMRGMLDEPASKVVLSHIQRNKITLHPQTEIAGVVGRIGVVAGVITNHQEMIPCQLVLACTGTNPVTTLAERSSVPIKNNHGIIVDDKLRSSVRDIYAAGDVAAIKNPQTGKYEPRALWDAAGYQGRIAGAMLAGRQDSAIQPFGVTWHATHLGELSMLRVGDTLSKDPRVMVLTDRSKDGYRRMSMLDDRLVGYLSLGSTQPDSLAIKRIIDEGHSIRNVTNALLKGKLDTRQYLLQMGSRAASGMFTSRDTPPQIAPAAWEREQGISQPIPPQPRRFPDTGPLAAVSVPPRQTPAQLPQPSVTPVQAEAAEVIPYYEEEISPFVGSLPDISFHGLYEPGAKLVLNVDNGSDSPEEMVIEDLSPFMDNLPALEQQPVADAEDPYEQKNSQMFAQHLKSLTGSFPALKQRIIKPSPSLPGNMNEDYIEEEVSAWGDSPTPQESRPKRTGLWAYGNQPQPARREKLP